MERQNEYVLRAVEERGIKLIRLWFTDVVGQLKSVAISPAELETALEEEQCEAALVSLFAYRCRIDQ